MVKSVGRNPKLTAEEVRKIISLFRENVKPMGNISYSEIYQYASQLYEEGKISASASDNFWRKEGRIGRIEVDKANEVFSEVVTLAKGKEVKIPNMADLVEKKYKNKDDLMKHLLLIERHFQDSLEREKSLIKEKQDLQEALETAKIDVKKEQEKNEELQQLVYKQSRILSDYPNEDSKTLVRHAMNSVFKNPTDFLKFEEKQRSQETSNVVALNESNQKKSLSSRFRKS